MNIFGGANGQTMDRGPRGPRGFRGRDSSIIDFCTWLPKTVLNSLQVNDERGAFFIEHPEKDLIRKEKVITEWVSRSKRGFNFKAKNNQPSSEIEKIEGIFCDTDRYAMKFKTTHYYAPALLFLPALPQASGYICITFRTYSEMGEQVLICGHEPSHHHKPPIPGSEIKISGATEIIIQIHDVKEIIQHSCKEWTTLFVEHNADEHSAHFTYDVNNGSITGSFTTPIVHHYRSGLHLGCRWDGTCHLDGQIVSVETYENTNSAAPIPDTLKNAVINNQRIY